MLIFHVAVLNTETTFTFILNWVRNFPFFNPTFYMYRRRTICLCNFVYWIGMLFEYTRKCYYHNIWVVVRECEMSSVNNSDNINVVSKLSVFLKSHLMSQTSCYWRNESTKSYIYATINYLCLYASCLLPKKLILVTTIVFLLVTDQNIQTDRSLNLLRSNFAFNWPLNFSFRIKYFRGTQIIVKLNTHKTALKLDILQWITLT